MLNPIYTFLIGSLAIIGCCNTPGFREVVLFILVGEMVLPSCNKLQDDQGRCPGTEAIRWRVTAGILNLCRK